MCFSNLPIEFDEEGNPHLADEADEIDGIPTSGCDCGADAEDVSLDESDPEAVYEDVLRTMPPAVRERITDRTGATGDGRERSMEGD